MFKEFLILSLDHSHLVASDGHLQTELINTTKLLMVPASRAEVFVQGPPEGVYTLKALYFNTGPEGDTYLEANLLNVVSKAPQIGMEDTVGFVDLPTNGFVPPSSDLRNATISTVRTIVFSETETEFLINGGD